MAIVIIAIVSAINATMSSTEGMTEWQLANVEALGRGEITIHCDGTSVECFSIEFPDLDLIIEFHVGKYLGYTIQ